MHTLTLSGEWRTSLGDLQVVPSFKLKLAAAPPEAAGRAEQTLTLKAQLTW